MRSICLGIALSLVALPTTAWPCTTGPEGWGPEGDWGSDGWSVPADGPLVIKMAWSFGWEDNFEELVPDDLSIELTDGAGTTASGTWQVETEGTRARVVWYPDQPLGTGPYQLTVAHPLAARRDDRVVDDELVVAPAPPSIDPPSLTLHDAYQRQVGVGDQWCCTLANPDCSEIPERCWSADYTYPTFLQIFTDTPRNNPTNWTTLRWYLVEDGESRAVSENEVLFAEDAPLPHCVEVEMYDEVRDMASPRARVCLESKDGVEAINRDSEYWGIEDCVPGSEPPPGFLPADTTVGSSNNADSGSNNVDNVDSGSSRDAGGDDNNAGTRGATGGGCATTSSAQRPGALLLALLFALRKRRGRRMTHGPPAVSN